MVQWIFITALTLVSALALALVYGLGGVYALAGVLDAGAVVSLALLLTRLYAPLTALASARVEVMSALVSFERVFEILDLTPLIQEKPGRRTGSRRPGRGRVRRRPLRLPVGRQGVAGLAGGGVDAGHPRRGRGAARHLVPRRARARWSPWSAPRVRGNRPSRNWFRGCTTPTRATVRISGIRHQGPEHRFAARNDRHGHPGRPPVPRVGAGEPAARPAGGHRGGALGGAGPGPAAGAGHLAARRPGHRGRRTRVPALRR